jgi:putative molybdopterin biosynthesis protein
MGERHKAEPAANIENCLRRLRTERKLSQSELADMAGVTRQAIYAIEASRYLPTTAVALRLATALNCRVEDLFSLIAPGEMIEGQLIGAESVSPRTRVKVARVGDRYVIRPVAGLGEVLNFTVAADGLMRGVVHTGGGRKPGSVKVDLLRDRRSVDDELVVGGCDPAISLAGAYFRRRDRRGSVIGWTMGSAAALEALKREEVHVAGLHIVDEKSGESNVPYVRRHMKGQALTIVTFASWEQGLMIRTGNPKGIRSIADLARKGVTLVNREPGAGARLLLDQRLAAAGVASTQISGYQRMGRSHLEVGRLIAEGVADVGMGVRSAANLLNLDFIPLQEERYDLVIPSKYLKVHPGLTLFLDTLVSRPFRREMEAMGGYDTKETGRMQSL